MRKDRALAVAVVIAVVVSAGSASAEQVPWHGIMVDAATAAAQPEVRGGAHLEGDAPDTYGTAEWVGYAVGPCDAVLRTASPVNANNSNCEKIEANVDGSTYVGFPVHLPQGVSVQFVRIFYYGNNVGVTISAGLWKSNAGSMELVSTASPAATAAGNTNQTFGPFSETVDNSPGSGYQYFFLAILPKSGASITGIHKIYIYYKPQISPAPPTATFSDVPVGYWARQHIEALAASGITGGCAPGLYCPGNNVTRAEMAVFLAKALGLHFQY